MNLCFLGGGNMASALIGGFLDSHMPITQIHVVEPATQTRDALTQRFLAKAKTKGIEFSTDARDCPASIAAQAPHVWIILAVKPQQMKEACTQASTHVKALLTQGHILSIAAGISVDALSAWCGNNKIVRAMPNTPALVGRGVTGLFGAGTVSAQARQEAAQLMQAVGQTVWIDQESLMDAVTALSGSGPAYVFRFIEALIQAGEQLGLSREQSGILAIQTLEGTLALLKSSEDSPAQLREKVTSKGGTTAAALASLDEAGFMDVIAQALRAARDRGTEMSRDFR